MTIRPTRFRLAEVLAAQEPRITQTELARLSGVSAVTVSYVATNKTRRVDLATLGAIAHVLGIAPGELIESAD